MEQQDLWTDPSYDESAAAYLLATSRFVALTGAGISTDSGIPDYRGPESPARRPMSYQEFVGDHAARQRYWARSHVGWTRTDRAEPNAGHHALARLEASGRVAHLVTQNVDGLHERAGSRRLCALHGRIADVACLSCGDRSSRQRLHERLTALNPGFAERHAAVALRPDGDVDLAATDGFRVPDCERCGGVLKPDVVFFGENVPKARVQRCYEAVESAQALLVAGSSLTVMSGFRFVRHAHKLGLPVVIVNRGPTRADELATYKLDMGTSDFLPRLLADDTAEPAGAPPRSERRQETSRLTEKTSPASASSTPYPSSTRPPTHQSR